MFRKLFLGAFLIVFIVAAPLLAKPAAAHAAMPAQPASAGQGKNTGEQQEAFIIEQSLTSEAFEADGTGTYENALRVQVRSEAGVQQFGLLTVAYEKNFETADFEYVRVRKPDGAVINTSLDNVQDIEAEVVVRRSAPGTDLYPGFRELAIGACDRRDSFICRACGTSHLVVD